MSDVAVWGTRGRVPTTSSSGSGNPFVVAPADTATPFSGSRLLDDGAQLRVAIGNRDWVSGSLAAVSAVADAVSFALNPIAGLVAMGVGWVLDHIEPLKGWLNELTGNAGAVASGGATWANIQAGLEAAADDLLASLRGTLAEAHSQAVDAYKRLMGDVGDHLGMAAGLAGAISTGLTVASTIVQFVHDLVRDAIADVVGTAVSCIIPLPNVIADLVAKVAKWTTRIGTKIDDLIRSFDKLRALFTRTDALLSKLSTVFNKLSLPFVKLNEFTTDVGQRLGNGAKELPGIASAWMKPRFSDRALAGLPSAKEELTDLLTMPDTILEFRNRGLEPWSLQEFLAKQQLGVNDLSAVDLQMMAHLRSNVGGIGDGTIMSKFHLTQGGVPDTYNDLGGFTARTQDLKGLDSGQSFEALRGDYAIASDATGPTKWNRYDPNQPLYETRVAADPGFRDRTTIGYSSDMVDETGAAVAPGAGHGRTADALNANDPTGPHTGHGFTSGTSDTVVPEDYTRRADAHDPVRYQETYDHDTGRRMSIVVHNPFSPNPGAAIRIPTVR